MAEFMGIVKGTRGSASRLGSKKSGIIVQANGWNFGIKVYLQYDNTTGKQIAVISRTGGSSGGTERHEMTIHE